VLGILLDIATKPATGDGAIDFTWLFMKMMIVLIIVCVFAVVILKYVAPRIGLFKKINSNKYIEILGRRSLEHKKQLYIIKVGSRYALIGSSEHSVNLVMELDKKDVIGGGT